MRYLSSALAMAPVALGSSIQARQTTSNTAVINLSSNTGTPAHLAAGVLYGITENATQIPSSFYTGMGFNYARIGGAQLTAGGWITGPSGYEGRFQNTLSDYGEARKFGAPVIILNHDIWGTDHANSSTVWPGDNGEWSDYDDFLNTLLGDLKSNNMLTGLVIDIWNEPDGSGFWARNQTQYLAMWARTYNRIRSDSSFNNVSISGPSSATQPGGTWWATWLQYVVANNVIPQQWSWHSEPSDPQTDYANLQTQLTKYSAPNRTVNINEYATYAEQVSAGAAWYISRLERINAYGLRGNWLSTCQLHDFLASLLTKTNTSDCTGTGYAANGEWQVYNYYTQNMTGHRVATTSSGSLDVYSTVGTDKVRILAGVLGSQTGTWYITINNLSSIGLATSGTLNITTYGLIDSGHEVAVSSPTTSPRGTYGHTYSGNTVTFPVYQTKADLNTAWIFEFPV